MSIFKRLFSAFRVRERAAEKGIPMTTMPGKTMIYNDAPCMAGAEIVDDKDGSRICLSNTETVACFIEANGRLSDKEVATLLDMALRAEISRVPARGFTALRHKVLGL